MAEDGGAARSGLARFFEHFASVDVQDASPLYECVALAVAQSSDALAVVERAPKARQRPTGLLAALHDLVLRGEAPDLAAAYEARDGDAAADAALSTIAGHADAIVELMTRRETQTNEVGRSAVLYPAVAEAARRLNASSVALIDVGCSAGLNLQLDRMGITYSGGLFLGDPASSVQLACEERGALGVPATPIPPVAVRIGIDLTPLDATDEADARWLRACLWPDQPERAERLDAAIALSAKDPPTLIAGDAIERLRDAFALVPDDAVPIVTTTWALAYFPLGDRLRFLRRLDELGATRPVGWVSGEGVGIAPAVPTMGDQRGAPHSMVGLALFDGRSMRVDAIARCHPHGRWLEWLG
ncbi:MAG: hypothetical protein QOF21_1092 [Actinomycetota bacterium]|jgi:hypothetical protein